MTARAFTVWDKYAVDFDEPNCTGKSQFQIVGLNFPQKHNYRSCNCDGAVQRLEFQAVSFLRAESQKELQANNGPLGTTIQTVQNIVGKYGGLLSMIAVSYVISDF